MNNRFKNWKRPEFDERGNTQWNWMCQHPDKLSLGRYTDIGAFTYINAYGGVEIEESVQIGSHCSIYSINTIDKTEGRVVIKKGAKIGTHSTVMPGVTVGENAIIGAYSFVKEDVPANALSYGVPAKVIRSLREDERENS